MPQRPWPLRLLLYAALVLAALAGVLIMGEILLRIVLGTSALDLANYSTVLFGWAVMVAFGAALVLRDPAESADASATPRPGWQRGVGFIVALAGALVCAAMAAGAYTWTTGTVTTAAPADRAAQLAPTVGFSLAAIALTWLGFARLAGPRAGGPEPAP